MGTAEPSSPARARFAPVWDVPVRLFHWLLVALIAASWWTGEHHDMDWHRRSGYAILALLVFRLYWGVAGGRTARFAGFVRGPCAVIGYLRTLGRREHAAPIGHNPLGGWSVVTMLGALVAMVGAGLFAVDVDGIESGPLADYVSFDAGRTAAHAHAWVFDALLVLMALHVVAILIHLVVFRHDLVGPMVHGRRRLEEVEAAEPLGASPWKALAGILLAVLFAWAVSTGFRF